MAGIKGRSGGKRTGAGRKSVYDKSEQKLIKLSAQTKKTLRYYSDSIGINESDLIEALCLLYLDKSNSDITHCPECGEPIFFDFVQGTIAGEIEITCQCGYGMKIGEPADSIENHLI